MSEKPFDEPETGAPAATDPHETDDAATSAAMAALKQERDDLHDRLLRQGAEFDNYRKRVERGRRELADQGNVDLLEELLLIVDDFELALTADAGDRPGSS